MLEQLKSIIVIAGCQRSGTTLCGQILGAHPSCFLLDEPDGLYNWFDKTVDGKFDEGHPLMALLNKANQKYQPQFWRIEGRGMDATLVESVEHLVLKAPNLTYDFERLRSLSLPVSVIYPVRDPRAVVASMQGLDFIVEMDQRQAHWLKKNSKLAEKYSELLERMENETAQHVRLALVWKLKTGLSEEFKAAGLCPLVFRYEDLVADPEAYRTKMFDHTGLDHSTAHPRHEDIFRGRGPGLTERTRPTDSTSIQKWRDRLTDGEATDIMREAGDLAIKYGYLRTNAISQTSTEPIANLDSPLVLVGRGGSGTRLLSEIVHAQGVFLGNRINSSGDSVEWVDTIYEIGARRALPSKGHELRPEKASQLLRGKAASILREGDWEADQSWGWKLPETMMVVPDVFQAFPKARLIHLVRHPMTSSLRRTHMTSRADNPIGVAVLTAAYREQGLDITRIKTDPDHLRNAYTWLYQVKRVHDFAQSKLGESSYKLVKYEDLISSPIATETDVIKFMGIDRPLSLSLQIEAGRASYHDSDDPRVAEVWSICGGFARSIGYETAKA